MKKSFMRVFAFILMMFTAIINTGVYAVENENQNENDVAIMGDSVHNDVYVSRNDVYAVFEDETGELGTYTFNGNYEVYYDNSTTHCISISKEIQDALQQDGQANGLNLVGFIVQPTFEVFSNRPISITYNYYGIEQTTQSITEGTGYTIQYFVPLGEFNGNMYGYLTFKNERGITLSSGFNMGAFFQQQ